MAEKIDPVEIIFRDLVRESPIPAKALAEATGKPHKTFLREVNPDDRRAKLGVGDVLPLLRASGDMRPLAYWAAECGFAICPVTAPAPNQDDLIRQALQAVADVGSAVEAFNAEVDHATPRFWRFRERCRRAMSCLAGLYHAAGRRSGRTVEHRSSSEYALDRA